MLSNSVQNSCLPRASTSRIAGAVPPAVGGRSQLWANELVVHMYEFQSTKPMGTTLRFVFARFAAVPRLDLERSSPWPKLYKLSDIFDTM